jgi:hypothetical protein
MRPLTDVPALPQQGSDEVPEEVREEMTFHPVMSVEEVIDLPEPAGARRMPPRCRNCTPVPTEMRDAAACSSAATMATIYACSSGASRFNGSAVPAGRSPTPLRAPSNL